MNQSTFIRATFIKVILLFLCFNVLAQTRSNQLIQVLVSPNKPSWTYSVNEPISFHVSILKNHIPMKNIEVTYNIGLEKMKPNQSNKAVLKESNQQIGKVEKINQAGFLRCEVSVNVDGQHYRGIATAAIDPQNIQPTQTMPSDFKEFWSTEIQNLKNIPLNPKINLIPEKSTDKINVFHISFQNEANGNRIYGVLSTPKKTGKYPAILHVPGAGVRPYEGITQYAEKGIISLQIGIHGIPINLPSEVYSNLSTGILKNYPFQNLDSRDHYFYKRVYLGCIRALDFIYQLDEFDQNNVIVHGGSQGGALSIITAALDNRVKGLVSLYPALSDLTGYLHQRAGGWPHMFNETNAAFMATELKIRNSAYYDVVNFATLVKVPGFYTWGYNDETCPPTSYYAAYNQITATKELYLVPETGHWTFAEQQTKISEWILNFLAKP